MLTPEPTLWVLRAWFSALHGNGQLFIPSATPLSEKHTTVRAFAPEDFMLWPWQAPDVGLALSYEACCSLGPLCMWHISTWYHSLWWLLTRGTWHLPSKVEPMTSGIQDLGAPPRSPGSKHAMCNIPRSPQGPMCRRLEYIRCKTQ